MVMLPAASIHMPDPVLNRVALSIGHLALGFGFFETMLNTSVRIIFQHVGKPKGIKVIPRDLSSRLDFMRDAVRQFPILDVFRAEIEACISIAGSLKDTRNHVLHGSMMDYDNATGLLTFIRLDVEKKQRQSHVPVPFRIKVLTLSQKGDETVALSARMLPVVESLNKTFVG